MSPLVTPENPGIGLVPRPVVPPAPRPDPVRAEFQRLSPTGQGFAALGEFGAAVRGEQSPLLAKAEARRKDKLLQMEELKGSTTALEHGVKLLEGMPEGPARKEFRDAYANRMESLDPGLGATFMNLSERPDFATRLNEYMPYLPEHLKSMSKLNPSGFLKFMGTAEGAKELGQAADMRDLKLATQKVQTAIVGYQQFMPPEEAKKIASDGVITASEVMSMQKYVPEAARLTDAEISAIKRNDKTFWLGLDVLHGDKENEVRAKRAEGGKMKPGTMTDIPLGGKQYAKGAYDPDKTLFPNAEHDANGFAILGKGTKEGTTINMPSSSGFGVDPKTGKESHWTLGKDGEVRWDPIQPSPKPVNPIQAAVAKAISDAGGGGNPAPKPGAGRAQPVAPAGIPAGSKKVGKSPDGKDVWEAPDGKRYTP